MTKEVKPELNTDTGRARNRPARVPLHTRRALDALAHPGFVRRFVNEDYGRVDAFIEAGWALVTNDKNESSEVRLQDGTAVGSVVRKVVNKGANANAKTAVLMEIPEEFFQEDARAKQAKVDEIEAAYDPAKFKLDPNAVNYGELKQKTKLGD